MMRITRANVEAAKEHLQEVTTAIENYETAADSWLEYQDERDSGMRPDPDDVRSARGDMEAALETLADLNVEPLPSEDLED